MKLDEAMIEQILSMKSVGEALRLLKAYAHEDPSMEKFIKKVTYGIEYTFHYMHYEQERYIERPGKGIVSIAGIDITYEDLWDEIDNRISLAQRTLLEHIEDHDIFEGR